MNDPLAFVSSVLALLALWILFDSGYRSYRISLLRDRLFQLRTELFEAARTGVFGEASFTNPLYLRTRQTLNGSIRFAHQFTFSRLLILLGSRRWWLDVAELRRDKAALHSTLWQQNPETRDRVRRITAEMDVALVMHMIHVNVVGCLVFTLLDLAFSCFHAQQRIRAMIATLTLRNRAMLEPLEAEALRGLEGLEHQRGV